MRNELGKAFLGAALFLSFLFGLAFMKQARGKSSSGAPASVAQKTPEFKPSVRFIGEEILPPQKASDFNLINQKNARVSLKDLRGKVVLLSFAYTTCVDICPLLYQGFLGVQRKLGKRINKDVSLVFISVDPEQDTPERMDYVTGLYEGKWHFLSGKEPALEKVWKDYKVYRKVKKTSVDHMGLTYLIDKNGLLRVRYLGTPPSKVLMTDVEKILGEG